MELFSEVEHTSDGSVCQCQQSQVTPLPDQAHSGGGEVGEPDAMMLDWNDWSYIYLVTPPSTVLCLRIMFKLPLFQGSTLLISSKCLTQPWCQELLSRCLDPLPLRENCLEELNLARMPYFVCISCMAFL